MSRFRKAYTDGWDSALIRPPGSTPQATNPYKRSDYASRWRKGREDCLANKPFPPGYLKVPEQPETSDMAPCEVCGKQIGRGLEICSALCRSVYEAHTY
jgi:hypothetical protein